MQLLASVMQQWVVQRVGTSFVAALSPSLPRADG